LIFRALVQVTSKNEIGAITMGTAWIGLIFAGIIVIAVSFIAWTTIHCSKSQNGGQNGEKVALAAITGLLSLASGGVGGVVASQSATKASEATGKAAGTAAAGAAGSAAAAAATHVSTTAVKEAATKAATKASGEVSRAIKKEKGR
jgi:hypothetical protein